MLSKIPDNSSIKYSWLDPQLESRIKKSLQDVGFISIDANNSYKDIQLFWDKSQNGFDMFVFINISEFPKSFSFDDLILRQKIIQNSIGFSLSIDRVEEYARMKIHLGLINSFLLSEEKNEKKI